MPTPPRRSFADDASAQRLGTGKLPVAGLEPALAAQEGCR